MYSFSMVPSEPPCIRIGESEEEFRGRERLYYRAIEAKRKMELARIDADVARKQIEEISRVAITAAPYVHSLNAELRVDTPSGRYQTKIKCRFNGG